MEIYFTSAIDIQEAEKLICDVSGSAEQSILDGYPAEHGGIKLSFNNGYVAVTGGGVLYGHVVRSVGGGAQSCAIVGFHRDGSITDACKSAGWHKTRIYDWVIPFMKGCAQGHQSFIGTYLYAPSNLDPNVAI